MSYPFPRHSANHFFIAAPTPPFLACLIMVTFSNDVSRTTSAVRPVKQSSTTTIRSTKSRIASKTLLIWLSTLNTGSTTPIIRSNNMSSSFSGFALQLTSHSVSRDHLDMRIRLEICAYLTCHILEQAYDTGKSKEKHWNEISIPG